MTYGNRPDTLCLMSNLAASDGPVISGPVLLTLLLIGGVIYVFGYLRAVMHRANKDYKTTKAAVKPLRKAFWVAFWNATKIGFWVVVAFLILLAWVVHDVRNTPESKPAPSSSVPAKVVKSVAPRR